MRRNPDNDPWMEPKFTERVKRTGLISMIENARRNGSSCGWARPVGGGEYDCVYTSPGDDSDHGWLTGHMGYDPGYDGGEGWYDAMKGGWIRFAVFHGHADPKVMGIIYLSGVNTSKLKAMFNAIPRHASWDATVVRHRLIGDEAKTDTIINQRRLNPRRRRNPSMNMRDITKISISILHAEPKGSEWRKVRSAKGVNNGACDLWARVAQEKYGGEIVFFDRADRRSEWEQYDRPPHGWGHGSAGTAHCAVFLDGLYYDAENPTGVESVADLNYMKRW